MYHIKGSEVKYQLIKSDYKYRSYSDNKFKLWADEINMQQYDFNKVQYYSFDKRRLATFQDNPRELALLNCISSKLNKHFEIKYSNRNSLIREMVNNLLALTLMNDYTIVKFDFKKYFPSISTKYIFDNYIKHSSLSREEKYVICKFCENIHYCTPGMSISNTFSELIAKDFDELLIKKLSTEGILFYKRYVDDVIILLNNHIDQSEVLNTINETINDIYYINNNSSHLNRTRLNQRKLQVLNKRSITPSCSFDFLGYEFIFKSDTDFEVGITEKKRMKYKKRIKNIVLKTKHNKTLLRHAIKANSSRIVYCTSKNEKKTLWKVKGIVSNYIELRRFQSKINSNTVNFLKNVYFQVFKELGLPIPHYLSVNRYKLYYNLLNNTTMIFDSKIGVDKETLRKNIVSIGGTYDTDHTYIQLTRNYLIAIKVGH